MKRKYSSPEVEVISLKTVDVLTASTYSPDPEYPVRSGNDDFEGEL